MKSNEHTLSDFDFHLPPELLATYPSSVRDKSRLMVVSRSNQSVSHHQFDEIGAFFSPGDLMVMNDTRVIPARLTARKEHMQKGAKIDVLLVKEVEQPVPAWVMYLDPVKKLKIGHKLLFGNEPITGIFAKRLSERECLVEFPFENNRSILRQKLFDLGSTPLPPYIKRRPDPSDRARYQTVYASKDGALAAPTAGLHFTVELLKELSTCGVMRATVTLHVGPGTFNIIHEENLDAVQLHEEQYDVGVEAAQLINGIDKSRNLLCAIGTTTMRTLESAVSAEGIVLPGTGHSKLFIRPPYKFKTANAMLTNFHTPKSSLLMMISAYIGFDFARAVYNEAISERYRFFSYGDAMLILP